MARKSNFKPKDEPKAAPKAKPTAADRRKKLYDHDRSRERRGDKE